MEKLVSVIIPVFNAEHYIRECLDSVLGQSYKNLEIILTDDGSTDSTKDLLSEYTFLDSRIKIIHQSNKGPAAARNSSLTEARGEYIVFFDADDVMFRDKISQQVGWLEKNKKYDFVFSDFIFHINGTEKYYRHRKFLPITEDQYADMVSRGGLNPSVVCMRRKVYEYIGGFNEAEDMIGVEDLEYFLRVARSHFLIGSQSDFLTLYRFGHSNLSSNQVRMYTRAVKVLSSQYQNDISDKERQAIESKIKNWDTKKKILKFKKYIILKNIIQLFESFYHSLYYKSLNETEVAQIIKE